jgi:hypothetical protein
MTEKKIKKENQLFKTEVPSHMLLDFLKVNCDETETHFIINKFLYKKMIYNNHISAFTAALKPYYYLSKMKYIERVMTYNSFLTIIRQLCNAQNIKYISSLVYDKSSYEITYSICKPC